MQIERFASQRRETISLYLLDSISKFEEGWKVHEAALLKYELTQAKLTKYDKVDDGQSEVHWVHKETGEISLKHPGHKYFRQNRKAMRERAEAKFKKDVIDRVEYEREALEIKTEK